MKKIIMLVLSFSLIFSSAAPFIINVSAQTNNPQVATELIESAELQISHKGDATVNLKKTDKEVVLDVEKNSELENNLVTIELSEGLSYSDDNDKVTYDETKKEVTLEMDKNEDKVSLKLDVDTNEITSNLASLKAEMKTDDATIESNPFTIIVLEEQVKEEQVKEEQVKEEQVKEEQVKEEESAIVAPNNGKKEKNTTTKKSSKATKTGGRDNGNGMTTKEGVPNAPKPAEELRADPEKSNEVNVSTWAELKAAVPDKSINKIFVTEDIYATLNDENIYIYNLHNIDIQGNGHSIDFRHSRFYSSAATPANTDLKVQFNNLTLYGSDFYGPFNFTGTVPATSSGALVYNDVTYVGAQLTASYTWDIEFKGKVDAHSVANYISPSTGAATATDAGGEENIEAKQINFHDNADYKGSTTRSQIFYLTGTGGIKVGKNAKIDLTNGSVGLRSWYAVSLEGALTLDDNSEFIINADGAPGASIILNSANTSITAGKNSKFIVNEPNETGATYSVFLSGANSSINLQEGAEFIINATNLQNSYPVLYMASNTSFTVEDSAKLNINVNNKTSPWADIQVANDAKFTVKDNGEFNVSETNKKNAAGSIIQVSTNSSFIIGKKATFNVISDGAASHNLIDLGANSTFQFADAQKVNMQFTNANLSPSARLINIAGSAGTLDVDVQDVKAWGRSDIAGNSTNDPDYHWTPMFGMITKFNGGTGTVTEVSSVMNSEREKYTEQFKPQNFSRLLYTYIEDVETGILNPLTDNITSVDSEVVKGVANPGAYVRLTGDPALPEPKIPSIVDGAEDPELTDDYTVIADETGNFEVKAKEGMHFTAENNIKAYAFLGGKMDSDTVKVLDETAPTGEGVNLSMIYSDQLPKEKQFIINPKDSNPKNEGFTYAFKEDYSALATQEGIHDIIIVLGDTAGNKADIPVKLEVTKDGYGVKADDFTITLSDLKAFDTEAKLKEILLTESKATAYGLVENELQDLTEHLTVNDLANIDQMKAGKYDIKIGFDVSTAEQPDAKADGGFTVTVLNDEEVNPTNPENPGGGEPEEVENGGTGQTGLLKLDYAPSNFAFGEVKFGFDSVKTNAVKTTSDKQWLQVSDHRADEDITNWSVQVSENHELATANGEELVGSTISIPKGQMYNEKTGEEEVTNGQLNSQQVDITTTPQTIFSANNTSSKIKNTSTNVWKATDVSLSIPGGQEAEFTDYSNTVTWSLVAEPTE